MIAALGPQSRDKKRRDRTKNENFNLTLVEIADSLQETVWLGRT